MNSNESKATTPTPGPSSPLITPVVQDFTGMATERFSDEICRILAECPDHSAVEVKPEGICYMPGVWYRRQLTRAFGAGGWALKPTGPVRTVGNTVEWSGALYCHGRWVAEAVGGQQTSEWMNHADAIQGAKTDCLSKCCGHGLAMASELWDKTWREAWMDEYTEEYKDKNGKTRYRLREKREPQAADLMRDRPSSATPQPAPVPTVSTAPDSTATAQAALPLDGATSSATAPKAETPVDPLMLNARKAVRDQFKRLKFTGTEAKRWLSTKFGVDAIPKLDEEQIDNCHALLACLGADDKEPPAKYLSMIDNLRSNGKILKEAR